MMEDFRGNPEHGVAWVMIALLTVIFLIPAALLYFYFEWERAVIGTAVVYTLLVFWLAWRVGLIRISNDGGNDDSRRRA